MKQLDAVVFDGDDTLWETQPLYDAAKAQYVELLQRNRLNTDNALIDLDNLDAARVPLRGLGPTRFIESMIVFAAILVGKQGGTWSESLEQEIWKLQSLVETPPTPYPDTESALRILTGRCALYLFTAGDEALQRQKIATLHLGGFFRDVKVTAFDKGKILADLVREAVLLPSRTCVVGNSLNSDVLPALRLGFQTIWIDRKTWCYDKSPSKCALPAGVRIVRSLTEALAILTPMLEEDPP